VFTNVEVKLQSGELAVPFVVFEKVWEQGGRRPTTFIA
jgi:hypothetical protein